MSLLSHNRGTDTITVTLRERATDTSRRATFREIGKVLVTGRMQPSTSADAERLAASGVRVDQVVRFICSQWPGDSDSLAEHDGVLYEVVGSVNRHHGSPMTSRDVVLLSAKSQGGQ